MPPGIIVTMPARDCQVVRGGIGGAGGTFVSVSGEWKDGFAESGKCGKVVRVYVCVCVCLSVSLSLSLSLCLSLCLSVF